MSGNFEAGRKAYLEGKEASSNPYLDGFTKLGNPKFSDLEAGCDWDNGFKSLVTRKASKKEIEAAASVCVSRFRRKSNKYYGY